jgi:hypothetical protein
MKLLIDLAVDLLKIAKCPNCDGGGAIQVRTSSRQYVTREMAMDAGMPEMEGSLYSDNEWELEQCRWCDERSQVVFSYENPDVSADNK